MGKPVNIILLNKHSSKTTLDDTFPYLQSSALLIAHQSSFLLEYTVIDRDTHKWTTEESERLWSTHP